MPKRSQSDTKIVGKKTWAELWAASAPPDLPLQNDLEKDGWKTVNQISYIWRIAPNTTREKCISLTAQKKFEAIKCFIGRNRAVGTMYRPKSEQS